MTDSPEFFKMSKAEVAAGLKWLDDLENARNLILEALNEDPAFVRETSRVREDLLQLRQLKEAIFKDFFRGFGFGLIYKPSELAKLLSGIKDDEAREVLRKYTKYAARFQVRMRFEGNDLHVVPVAPYNKRFHVRVNNGRLEAASEQVRSEPEPVFEDLYAEDELPIPETLAKFLDRGRAKVVQVDDHKGTSILNQLESISYRNDSLTFILHDTGAQKYIFCLVGERVTTDTTWRDAGKVITALQKQFYGRTKSGRPTNFSKLGKRTALNKERGAQKQAHTLIPEHSETQSDIQTSTQVSQSHAQPAQVSDPGKQQATAQPHVSETKKEA